jgi:hypothetical protein
MNFNDVLISDSIIYITTPKDTYMVPTGSYLGDMTNELTGYGSDAYIHEFVAGGPKNYGYRVQDVDGNIVAEVNKVRGIRLSFKNKQSVNFEALKKMVFAFCLSNNTMIKTILEKRISRDHERNVFTQTFKKDYRVVYDKISIFPQFCTLPFGY